MIELYDDPHAFLAVAEDHLRADPVRATVLATATLEDARDRAAGVPLPSGRPRWWAVSRDATGAVHGCAFRSPTPFPPYLLPLPADDAAALAHLLHERGEEVRGASGATEACHAFADAWVDAAGGTTRPLVHSRLHELTDLMTPTGVPGRLRAAEPTDVRVLAEHLTGFWRDTETQAGRDPGDRPHEDLDEPALLRRVASGGFWLWDVDGLAVCLVGDHAPTFGAARVGPVHTLPEHRGRGYAAAATAAVSAQVLRSGARPCLFTDLANPTSNGVYARIGYRPVGDYVELAISGAAPGR